MDLKLKHRSSAPEMRIANKPLVEVGIGIACALGLLVLMLALLLWTPLHAPFLFIPPLVMIVTLFARWPGGLAALVTTLAGIWTLLSIFPGRFETIEPSEPVRLIIFGFMGLMLLILTEAIRRTAQHKTRVAELEVAQREMSLRELEHRTRNNLMLIVNLLSMQSRQAASAEIASALDQALARVQTIADAYNQLSHLRTQADEVDMALYLERLLSSVASALFSDRIHVDHDIEDITLPASKAVAIGLYLNEALTNCAKHAFPDHREGKLRVVLRRQDDGWRLTIIDDGTGRGLGPEAVRKKTGGLGSVLFEALATQAGARHQVTLLDPGRRLDLISQS